MAAITTTDVREACDVLAPVYEATDGVDGRVSLEVDPRLAHDTEGTVAQAKALFATVDRPNVMIKIPATVEGLPAITAVLAEGISVNVTLIFSLDRYRAVINAWLDGLERAVENGKDVSTIHSVASFFVSRVDATVDKQLDALGTDEAKAAARARPPWPTPASPTRPSRRCCPPPAGATSPRRARTASARCGPRPASRTPPTRTPSTSSTSSRPTRSTPCPAAPCRRPRTTPRSPATRSGTPTTDASATLDAVERLGIGYADVVAGLEREGVEKFEASWGELLATVEQALAEARR